MGKPTGFIEYLREPKRLGTAGALSLLTEHPEHPVVVSNGDLLLRLDVGALIEHHTSINAEATMAVREFDYQVPYGVVCTKGDEIIGLEEKPVQRFLISGGLYVLSPSAFRHVPASTFYDMPTLFNDVVKAGGRHYVDEVVASIHQKFDPVEKAVVQYFGDPANAQLYIDVHRLEALHVSLKDVANFLAICPSIGSRRTR